VRGRYPDDEARLRRMSLIEETPVRQVRMANLAITGAHSKKERIKKYIYVCFFLTRIEIWLGLV